MTARATVLSLAILTCLLAGCVTSTVDKMVFNEPAEGVGDAGVVILGRRHASDYDTEPDFVSCVGKYIAGRDKSVRVIGELEFLNSFYPWFEPRTAALTPEGLDVLMQRPAVAARFAELNVEYMIWIDGTTERTDQAGSMACSVSPVGGGCFGFGMWTNDANYEATIWDFSDRAEVGRVNTKATGQSYMPAVIVPIPIIAPVQGTACDGIAEQLLQFLSGKY